MKAPIYFFVCISTFLFSCKKEKVEVNQPVASQNLKGDVVLFDDEDLLLIDQSGVTVTVENSNPLISVKANSKGEFELPKLETEGTIVLVYSKEGFGDFKQYINKVQLDSVAKGIIQLGGSFIKTSPVVVNSLTGTVNGDTLNVSCNVSFTSEKDEKFIRFFRRINDSNVSPDRITLLTREVSNAIKVKNGDNYFKFSISGLKECSKYSSGDMIYMKAYGDVNFIYTYTDLLAQKVVFPATNRNGSGDVISFKVN